MPKPAQRLGIGLLAAAAAAGAIATPPSELMTAIRDSDHRRLQALLENGAAPNERQADGSLPLAWAIEMQDARSTQLLLRHGAWANDPAPTGNPFRPLFVACLHPVPSVLTQLLDAGADEQVTGPDGISALAACAAQAPLAIVARLIKAGAAVNHVDAHGQTALMHAAAQGRPEVFKLLLESGADLHAISNGGLTATHFAVKGGSVAVLRAALAAGADPAQRAPQDTSLVQLAMYQQAYAVAEYLVAAGVDLEAYDRNGHQLLHAAVQGKQPQLVSQLLAAGAPVNALSQSSKVRWRYESNFKAGDYEFPHSPPLLLAAAAGSTRIMQTLLDAGADPTLRASDGNHLVLAAAGSGEPAALALALKETKAANVQNPQGETALHRVLASATGPALKAMLALLHSHNARADLKDQRGRTPAAIAAEPNFKGAAAFAALFSD